MGHDFPVNYQLEILGSCRYSVMDDMGGVRIGARVGSLGVNDMNYLCDKGN